VTVSGVRLGVVLVESLMEIWLFGPSVTTDELVIILALEGAVFTMVAIFGELLLIMIVLL
jgi:hypothetical protein